MVISSSHTLPLPLVKFFPPIVHHMLCNVRSFLDVISSQRKDHLLKLLQQVSFIPASKSMFHQMSGRGLNHAKLCPQALPKPIVLYQVWEMAQGERNNEESTAEFLRNISLCMGDYKDCFPHSVPLHSDIVSKCLADVSRLAQPGDHLWAECLLNLLHLFSDSSLIHAYVRDKVSSFLLSFLTPNGRVWHLKKIPCYFLSLFFCSYTYKREGSYGFHAFGWERVLAKVWHDRYYYVTKPTHKPFSFQKPHRHLSPSSNLDNKQQLTTIFCILVMHYFW